MPVRKRGGSWQVTVCYASKVYRRSSRRWDRAHAQAVERKMLDDLKRAELGLSPIKTFNDAIERWVIEELPTKRCKRTWINNIKLIGSILEGRPLTDVEEVCRSIRQQRGKRGELTPATINRRLAIVRRLLSLAYKRWGWLDQPLHQRVQLLPERGERHVYLTPPQVEALAQACTHGSDAILLAAYTGIRRSQLLRLTAQNRIGDCLHLGTDGKTGQPQVIPLHPRVQRISLPLRVTNDVLRREWRAATARLGLHGVRFHDLRHTFASWLIQSGADLQHVRDFLGHSTVAVTQRYAHLRTEHLRRALERIETTQSLHSNLKQ